ncbi:Na(+)/dicarboxylate cotransporter 3-like isoform X1 [Dermacentor andersoni]|uniref:Na(+)/dicarboxylate cotransporter 3-like isoform X1 n=1 Tax=Dermacentor andersoni TaxID=34620 RepID=UPI0024170163|nr:Na(+)/dicarboxylate cotransporter 3-like isoform X1 [Dermacentor andersoni]
MPSEGPFTYEWFARRRFPEANELTYAWWMLLNGPAMIMLLLLAYAYVQWSIERKGGATMLGGAAEARLTAEVTRKYNDLGPLSFAEATVVFMVVLMVLLLLTMKPQILPGWSSMFPEPQYIRASVPMVLVSVLLFVIPRNPTINETVPILTWDEVNSRVSWGTVLVICGGMTLAEASKKSGLSRTVATTLAVLESVPSKLVLSALCLLASFMSELASNSAVSSLMIPVVIDLARPGVLMNLMTVTGEILSVHIVAMYLLGLDSVPWWAKEYSISLANTNTSHLARAARRAGVDIVESVAPPGPHARW